MNKDKLLRDLTDDDPNIREQAVIELRKLNDPGTVSVLVKLSFHDPHHVVRQSALDALRNMDCVEAKAAMAQIDLLYPKLGEPGPRLQSASAQEEKREQGKREMMIGGIALIGLLITRLTYAVASGSGGGFYIITWGAILFGGLKFFQGLSKL
ncbi:MAG: HEAT repeat domain-containing protein [Chloroflexi bacterium]|nr:HEAT repeat domain-containing protein [Chloroflexota bacterium]